MRTKPPERDKAGTKRRGEDGLYENEFDPEGWYEEGLHKRHRDHEPGDPEFEGMLETRLGLVEEYGEEEVSKIEGLVGSWVKEINEAGIEEEDDEGYEWSGTRCEHVAQSLSLGHPCYYSCCVVCGRTAASFPSLA